MRIPDKERYYLREAAQMLSALCDCKTATARTRVYRAIERGDIAAIRVGGLRMLDRQNLLKLLNGDTYV